MDLSEKPDFVIRPLTHFVYLRKRGPFATAAPIAWQEFSPVAHASFQKSDIVGMLGLSGMDKTRSGDDAMIYDAGLALRAKPQAVPKSLEYRVIESGRYARFLLKGSYTNLGVAMQKIFRTLEEMGARVRPEFCAEHYLNTPGQVSEDELLTELLIPVED